MALRVKITGIKDLQRKLAKMGFVAAQNAQETALAAGLKPIENEAKRRVHKVTSTLSRSIHTEVKSSQGRSEGRTGTNLEYAAMQEFGTAGLPGGVLRPKNAPYLVFEIGGQIVRTKEVSREGHPYLRPAFDSKKKEAIEETKRVLRKMVLQAAQ